MQLISQMEKVHLWAEMLLCRWTIQPAYDWELLARVEKQTNEKTQQKKKKRGEKEIEILKSDQGEQIA